VARFRDGAWVPHGSGSLSDLVTNLLKNLLG
jgi:hypothetical protein